MFKELGDALLRHVPDIVTADHAEGWDFGDPAEENEWMIKAWGSQLELRNVQKRNRDETVQPADECAVKCDEGVVEVEHRSQRVARRLNC